jgi:hypothetical protein
MVLFKNWRIIRLQDKIAVAEAKLGYERDCSKRTGVEYPIVQSELIGEIALCKRKLARLEKHNG